jgi:hypothetical protein
MERLMKARFHMAALVAACIASAPTHAGSVLTQGQLNAELGQSCAAQGKAPPCITAAQMSDLISSAAPRLVTGSVVAAGTAQGTATALIGQTSDVTTVPAGSGVALPPAVAGQVDVVCDSGVNQLLVYPASGAAIGSLAANLPVTVPAGQCAQFSAISATAWRNTIVVSPVASAPGFYVSPSGSDTNAGTRASPFSTLGKCQTAIRGAGFGTPPVPKTCYLMSGTYNLSTGLTLDYRDAGETWTYDPADGINSPSLTQTGCSGAGCIYFTLNTGADNVTITGLTATGASILYHGSCFGAPSNEAVFVLSNVGSSTPTNALAPNNTTITYNVLNSFDCGVALVHAYNPVVSFNRMSTTSYAGAMCLACIGLAQQTIWQGNVFYDLNAGGSIGTNAYGISFTLDWPNTNPTTNFTGLNNLAFNSTWVCFDNHGGSKIFWINNLCIEGPGATGGGGSIASHGIYPNGPGITDVQLIGNIIDLGTGANQPGTALYVVEGSDYHNNNFITCDTGYCNLSNNIELLSATKGWGFPDYISPIISQSNNTGNIDPEQVSTIRFVATGNCGSATSCTMTHGQANAVVGTLVVNMSNTYWSFPIPPGSLSIGGNNLGQFVICNQNQICQPAAGGAANTYSDFSITATLHGMLGSPALGAASGALLITLN